jgi:hypothetical protein
VSGALTDAHHDWVADTFGIDPRSYACSPPASPDPAPPEGSGGLLGALSHAAAAVGDAVRGAATGACDAAASLASQAGDAVAGTGAVGAAVLDSVKMDVDFGKGVVEGVAAGVTGLVTGAAEGDAVSSTMSEGRTGPIETPKGARGPASGRDFDPDKAGGPIEPKSLDDVKITHEGVDKVESHVSRFGSDPNNDAMMARQRAIADGKLEASIEDKAFHAHELDEYQRYQNLGFKDGIPDDPEEAFQLWNNAHTAALEDYGMSEVVTDTLTGRQRSTLYHPSCDPRLGN